MDMDGILYLILFAISDEIQQHYHRNFNFCSCDNPITIMLMGSGTDYFSSLANNAGDCFFHDTLVL